MFDSPDILMLPVNVAWFQQQPIALKNIFLNASFTVAENPERSFSTNRFSQLIS
jgi:hypothetical protein